MELNYGKKITHDSFHNGKLMSTKTEYSVPIIVQDRTQAMSEIMKSVDLIDTRETCKVIITLEADPKTYKLRMITRNFII